ncbi:centrosomal protein of 120 kDa-like [Macrosteles quadrilineatus]|uniref:centrosomal protein of 120 kDa-like n=1 Tax=Macrosteles quadrilineatus TaxID=74068 RepID=UPI0023E14747|nr:centrosomal protein of 120 kDa-like [Macrosteles quadrilineatus]
MSLRDLKDEIYLILQIKEGYSFGFATSPLVITANLAGNIHESFIVEPSHQPKFENVFVWIMDKTKMKNIWAEKLPVRIECFSVNQSQRSRIGYIILNVKDAQIAQDEAKITEKQMRLLGLSRDASLLKPELVFSFYLTDVPIQSSLLKPQFSPRMDGSRLKVTSEPVKVVLPPGRDNITLTIDVIKTHNLEKLLPSQSEGDLPEIKYCYNLLDRDFVSDGRLQVSLQSCMSSVNNYLCNSTVSVTVDNTTLGHTVIDMKVSHSMSIQPARQRLCIRCLLDRDFVSDGRLQVSLQSCMSSVNNYLCNSTVSVTVDNTTLGHTVIDMKVSHSMSIQPARQRLFSVTVDNTTLGHTVIDMKVSHSMSIQPARQRLCIRW